MNLLEHGEPEPPRERECPVTGGKCGCRTFCVMSAGSPAQALARRLLEQLGAIPEERPGA